MTPLRSRAIILHFPHGRAPQFHMVALYNPVPAPRFHMVALHKPVPAPQFHMVALHNPMPIPCTLRPIACLCLFPAQYINPCT